MKYILNLSSILMITLISCNSLEDKLAGGWAVDQAYYNNEPVIWDLYSNGLSLKEDNTCTLPPINTRSMRTIEEEKGTWQVYVDKNKIYLQINTGNRIFNRTFEVTNLREEQDPESLGNLLRMTLKADSLKLDCTKAL